MIVIDPFQKTTFPFCFFFENSTIYTIYIQYIYERRHDKLVQNCPFYPLGLAVHIYIYVSKKEKLFSEKLQLYTYGILSTCTNSFQKTTFIYIRVCTIVSIVVVVVVVVDCTYIILEIYVIDCLNKEQKQKKKTKTLKCLYKFSTCLTQHKHFIDN